MILRELKTWNFMRFRYMELKNIPERGIVAISGPNESGKSTVGHALFFALTGKATNSSSQLKHLINWEREQIKLEMTFEHGGSMYRLFRQVDCDGSNFSNLEREGESIAQGNPEVAKVLTGLLGYPPDESLAAFHITDINNFQSAQITPLQHIEKMLGLDKIKQVAAGQGEIADRKGGEIEQLIASREQLTKQEKEVGYNSEQEDSLHKRRDDLAEELEECEKQQGDNRREIEESQKDLESVEQAQKSLNARVAEMEADPLVDAELGSVVKGLSELDLSGRPGELLDEAVTALKDQSKFQASRDDLSKSFSKKLQELRLQIGLHEEGGEDEEKEEQKASGLKAQEDKLSLRMHSCRKSIRFWLFVSLIFLLALGGMSYAYASLDEIKNQIRSNPEWLEMFRMLPEDKVNYLRWLFARGPEGFPARPEAYFFISAYALIVLVLLGRVVSLFKRLSSVESAKAQLQQEIKTLHDLYNKLLPVDFRDIQEAMNIVAGTNHEELNKEFDAFRVENVSLASREFDSIAHLRNAKSLLEEAGQGISLRLHQMQKEINKRDEEAASVKNELKELAPVLEEMRKKKASFLEIQSKLSETEEKIDAARNELTIANYGKELSEGTLASVHSRLGRVFTGLFKRLLPRITQARYNSVRLDEDYNIHVFSEERSDFVPLKQLSSGTHDLLLLLFQLILTNGFLESHNLDRHFLFLDEPLLSVDQTRYGRLCELLNALSPRISQVFLCHPPEDLANAKCISTDLSRKDLVVDFSTLRNS